MRLSFGNVVGLVEGLLLVRLIGLLFAVRPDNAAFNLVFALTTPLIWPWTWLDRWAAQPRFGARLELATLAAMVLVALLALIGMYYRRRRAFALNQHSGALERR